MGVLAVGVGNVQEALPFFKTALEANPSTVQFWLSNIDAMNQAGKVKALVAAGVDKVKIQKQLNISKASYYRCLKV